MGIDLVCCEHCDRHVGQAMMRDPRAWRLWQAIRRDQCAAKILQRLTLKQARVFLKFMLEECGIVRNPQIKEFRP